MKEARRRASRFRRGSCREWPTAYSNRFNPNDMAIMGSAYRLRCCLWSVIFFRGSRPLFRAESCECGLSKRVWNLTHLNKFYRNTIDPPRLKHDSPRAPSFGSKVLFVVLNIYIQALQRWFVLSSSKGIYRRRQLTLLGNQKCLISQFWKRSGNDGSSAL